MDNGSTDDTPSVAARYAGRLPLRYVCEPRPGKSHAVNTGLELAAGDLILFTDDDILPKPDWLLVYKAAADAHPDYTLFGGPITLRWPPVAGKDWIEPPPLIERSCFASTNPAFQTGPHQGGLGGGNFAVRREVIDRGERFPRHMGPNGTSFPQGNENFFVQRLVRSGYRKWWIAEASVEHIVRPEQMTKQYMFGRAIRAGRGEYICSVAEEGLPKLVFGFPRYALKKLVYSALHLGWSQLFGSDRDRFEARWNLLYAYGMLSESRRMGARAEAGAYGAVAQRSATEA